MSFIFVARFRTRFICSAKEENIRKDSERELPLPYFCDKSDATQLHILITLSFTLLHNIIIVITNNRLVSLLPIGSNLVIMSEIVNTPANKLLILAGFRYMKSN